MELVYRAGGQHISFPDRIVSSVEVEVTDWQGVHALLELTELLNIKGVVPSDIDQYLYSSVELQ